LVGSLLSSTVPDRYVRPAIAFAILASGLKYVGLSTTALGWTLCAVLLAGAIAWLAYARPWNRIDEEGMQQPAPAADPEQDSPGADTITAR
ncbi:MAG TPA: hypothetical protein VFW09_05585, partial [Solirubrobacteraceae bacterium]|nr:hypothetical protein [Solirubrobacteraceae bacterium]